MGNTTVRIGGNATQVTVRGGSTQRVTLDRRTVAAVANNRPTTVVQPGVTPIDVTQHNTVVRTGSAMGVQGRPGAAGGVTYTFSQPAPLATWTINHKLGGYPSVTVVNSAGELCQGAVTYVDENTLLLLFSAPFAGTAYLN